MLFRFQPIPAILLACLIAGGCSESSPPDQIAEASVQDPAMPDPSRPVDQANLNPIAQHDQTATVEKTSSEKLFDGSSLDGWKKTNFGGEGDVQVADGLLWLSMGYPMTGVHCTRTDLPTSNFEISLEAKRVQGTDFFCGLTFPVNDSHCSLIVGGWGGALVGLSCIDDQDASRNDTTRYMDFTEDRWYRIRVQVEADRIRGWIDDDEVVDQDIRGKKISLRNEVLPSRPLGICCFETKSAIRNIVLTRLDPKKPD